MILTGKTIGELANSNGITPNSLFAIEQSGATFNIPYSGLSTGGGTYEEVTYQELYDMYSGGTLQPGGFYLITDFNSCYDQPDFDSNNNPIIIGNYKQGPIEPLLVLAISANSISSQVYSTIYPFDKITYDITWNTTEVTNSPAKGRITERIDEFNNRTDYDHRNILFKRYRLFTIRPDQPLNGSVELQNDGTVLGTNTYFTGLTIGDVIYMNSNGLFYEITNITDNTTMSVSGDTINSFGCCSTFYKAIEETNGSGYFSYKQTNVKTYDYEEYTTFGDAISNSYVKNTYIGNYTNNYQNIGSGTFLLPNNVFLEGEYESNKFGDSCYNNTFGTDNQNNVWGDYCYENVSTNDIDGCSFGNYFNNNLINSNMEDSRIGNNFKGNKILGENSTNFRNNIIGDEFRDNVIYSDFYENDILYRFENNVIGDFGNLDNFQFYRNYISNYFINNKIRQTFQNNRVGTNFQNNEINGDFVSNTILNGFNNNETGYFFAHNSIGNGFNQNNVSDQFERNTTQHNFSNNEISYDFFSNDILDYFRFNRPSDNTLFNWNTLSTVSTRTYNNFNNVVGGGQLGNKLLGKELVMRVISTSQYFKFKILQWTQNGNGGGFQYERQEIDFNGNTIGPQILFTKRNYTNDTDIIIPGVVEITRDNNGGIYNLVTEGSWNSSVSPGDTEWNSIYTEPANGKRFAYNQIGNNFIQNIIGNDFGYGGLQDYGNQIGDQFSNNTIGDFMYNNVIGNYFENNLIGNDFEDNFIQNYFNNNTIGNNFKDNNIGNVFQGNQSIGNNFQSNNIGNYFLNNSTIGSDFQNNKIGNSFQQNQSIGNSFQNNTIGNNFETNNSILNNFQNNNIGNEFKLNVLINNNFKYNKIGNNFESNQSIGNTFQYNTIGDGFKSNQSINNFFIGNNIGNDFFLNGPIGTTFNNNNIGNVFQANQLIGNNFQNNNIGNNFGNNTIGNYFQQNTIKSPSVLNVNFTTATHVYGSYDCTIFQRPDGNFRLSYFDNSDVLNITNITS